MKASLLFVLACMAVLVAGDRADTPEELETLVSKVKEYTQKAAAMARTAFSVVQESEAAQQARRWLADNTDQAKQRLARLKEQLADLWKRTLAA